MDNLGDWLYIILLVIAGISGLLSSARKKKRSVETPSQPAEDIFQEKQEQDSKSFWEVLEDMHKEQTDAQQTKPQPKRQPVKQQAKQPAKYTSAYSTLKPTEYPEDDAFRISPESFHDTEELKKAIIYSEILNRKY